jgi:hypothetical protein
VSATSQKSDQVQDQIQEGHFDWTMHKEVLTEARTKRAELLKGLHQERTKNAE